MKVLVPPGALGGLLAVLVIGCQNDLSRESTTGPSFDRITPGASFEWSVPARFGMDGDGDGLTDYARTPQELKPAAWPVDFDACGIAPANGSTQYVWFVDQRKVAIVATCRWRHEFPAEGSYDVALHVTAVPGPGLWAEQRVTVQDWLVVSFGDSYASGEGAPEIPAANDQLVNSIVTTIESLGAAKTHLDQVLADLADAVADKGLAASILATRQQRRQDFLNACDDASWTGIQQCLDFVAGLPYSTYQSTLDHFDQAVQDAQERFDSLVLAVQAAQAAVASAQSAIAGLQATLAALQAGLGEARWEVPYPNEDWGGEDCHRSANSAPARAARALEQSDPHTSVTFVHLACTGARVDKFRASLEQQIPWAEQLVGSREIDAVLVSIGGNDAGFASIATACVIEQACYDDAPAFNPGAADGYCSLLGLIGLQPQCSDLFGAIPSQSAKQIVGDGVAALPAKYDEVANVLLPQLTGLLAPLAPYGPPGPALQPVDRVRSNRVYITQYVDMTKDDAGSYCSFDPDNLLGTIPGVSLDEMQWLDTGAAGQINQAVANAASDHGWNAVTGIYAGYAHHGYCADDHWVVRAHETFLRQGNKNGMAHPNDAGQSHNAQAIFAALTHDLYPEGLTGAPRAPDQPFLP